MSFIYSQALVAEFSRDNFLGIDVYAPLNGSHTPKPCLWHDKTMEPFRLSLFGLTCRPLTDDHGTALLTWWQEDSRARTSALQGGGQALTENAAECGTTWPASFAKYDPSSHTLKTAQLSLLEDLTACCATLPASGLMRDGECWELPTLAPHTSVTASGFLPTPTATDANGRTYYYSNGKKDGAVPSLCGVAKLLPTPAASDWKGVYTWETVKRRMQMTRGVLLPEELCRQAGKAITPNPEFWEWMMGWPIGSTGLKPLETDRFQEWQQQHSIY